jgi:hypothetical protein
MIMEEDVSMQEAREYMQKAYVTFSTISSINKVSKDETKRSRWADLVQQVAMEHSRYIAEFAAGKFYANIDKDPRDNAHADDKVDLKSLSQYKPGFSSQKTMIADDKVHVRPVKKSADKYIDKMIKLA